MTANLKKIRYALAGLSVYRNLLESMPVIKLKRIFELLDSENPDTLSLVDSYSALMNSLFVEAKESQALGSGNLWEDFVLQFLLYDDNVFTAQAANVPLVDIDLALLSAVKLDLSLLRVIYCCFPLVKEGLAAVLQKTDFALDLLPDIKDNVASSPSATPLPPAYRVPDINCKEALQRASSWEQQLEDLAFFYRQKGSGVLSKFIAFKWSDASNSLIGIEDIDPITLSTLTGYDDERASIVKNTQQFLRGYPANNILLYGDRGTGKSSTVKALLNEFWVQGLRLVEVSKDQLGRLPLVLEALRPHNKRFIIFVDDLSFDDGDAGYLGLKVILEGSLESKPENVLIYATSNRRHLIKEHFSDRNAGTITKGDDEIRTMDTLQEKLSLSDRFGITVIFPSPGQKLYLEIVRHLAAQKGLTIEDAVLQKQALQWALLHNGFSGRTAKQFVDQMAGEILSAN